MKMIELASHVPEIKELYLNKLWSAKKIAEHLDICVPTLRNFFCKNGIKRGYRLPPPHKIVFNEQEKADIITLYLSKELTTELIAKKYNCSRPVIRRILKEKSVPFMSMANAIRRSQLKDDFFDKIDSAAKATLLGLIASDGHNNEKNAIVITLQYGDVEYLKRFSNLIYGEDKTKIRYSERNGRVLKHCSLVLYSKKYSEVLKGMGISKNKTDNLRWPIGIPKKFIFDFLQGFFDGDGSISIYKKTSKIKYKNTCHVYESMACNVYIVGTKGMMKDILKRMSIYNIEGSLQWCGKKNPKVWKFVIGKNNSKLRFLNKIYRNREYALERKYGKFLAANDIISKRQHYTKIGEYSLDR